MNSKVIIGIVAAVIVLIGGGAALVMANNSKEETKKAETSHAATETSLSALQAKGEPRKCTFSSDVKNGNYSGTAYFSSDKQMRNDYKSTVNGKERNGGMIVSEETQYFWNNETKKGYKLAITKVDNSKTTSTSQANSSDNVDTKAKYSFHCESWTVDDSKFTPPSDIAIQDLTQVMQNIPTSN